MGPVQVQCKCVNVLQWLMCEFELSLLPGWSVELALEPRAGRDGVGMGTAQPCPASWKQEGADAARAAPAVPHARGISGGSDSFRWVTR